MAELVCGWRAFEAAIWLACGGEEEDDDNDDSAAAALDLLVTPDLAPPLTAAAC